ncbi:MAG: Asp-tRNA(Asn)/Glu-tRNA(Gln) amidotransferase subunit GatB [Phycisphaerales bacterium]
MQRSLDDIASIRPVIGMEIHVQLATQTKLLTRAPNTARPGAEESNPNTLTDRVVLALPGALPVMNRSAVELSMLVGLALGCRLNERTIWDRKSYFYPDLPKAYQTSQYDLPVCAEGVLDVPVMDESGFIDLSAQVNPVRITRAHLEEDAGKLVHEGARYSLVDLNRAGTPLLEIVTEPDMHSADEAVAFGRFVRTICKAVGATQGVMMRGHMRFEPNINLELTLKDGSVIATPIVEVKNLNSFRSLAGAIAYEIKQQPKRWADSGETHGQGMKSTRGWDDDKEITVLQRSKEDALDYRYFPEPDLAPVVLDQKWLSDILARMPELPLAKMMRYVKEQGLSERDAQQIAESRAASALFDGARTIAADLGVPAADADRHASILIIRSVTKTANDLGKSIGDLDLETARLAELVKLRHEDTVSAQSADAIVAAMIGSEESARAIAERHGLVQISDTGQLETWCDEVIAELPEMVEQIRAGKTAAIGRLIGEVKKKSGGSADAKLVRDILFAKIHNG